MFCPNCGNQVSGGTQFCPNCGTPISGGQASGPQYAPGPQGAPASPFVTSGGQQNYSKPPVYANFRRLKDDRSLPMYILLTLVTCGFYSWWFVHSIAEDLNVACEGDGEKTPGLAEYIIFSLLTCGFYNLWWIYKIGNRLADNAPRYNLRFQENGTTLLMWYLVGVLICGIGPFVAMHLIIRNTNQLASAYNQQVLGTY